MVYFFFFSVEQAKGQNVKKERESYKFDEVVITGTRTEKKLLEVPVRTEVVTREEIEQTHARDLKEALEDVPGLLLRQTHGKQGQEVWMQGFDSDRVLILLDGERLTATTGSTVDLTQITTANIERIEIIKGATSALYGSEAMGGVINVITKSPTKPLSFTFQSDAGSYGNKNREGAALNGNLGAAHYMADMNLNRPRWNLQLTTDLRQSEGIDLDKSSVRTDGDKGFRWNLDTRLAFRLPGNGEIYLSPHYYQEDKDRLFTTFVPGVGTSIRKYLEEAKRWRVSVGGKTLSETGSRLSVALTYEYLNDVSSQDIVASPQIDQKRTADIFKVTPAHGTRFGLRRSPLKQ